MEKRDFSDYEKRRAEQHEELCRAAALLFCLDCQFCHLRRCYRNRMCCGAMQPSPHQAGAVRAQRSIGLSGEACAELPLCVATMEPRMFEHYRKLRDNLRQLGIDSPDLNLVWASRWVAAKRRRMAP